MIKNIFVLISVLFLVSCTSSGLKYSAESVAGFWQAQDYDITDSGETGSKLVILSLEELPGVRPDYPLKSVADVTAVKFIDNMSEADKEEFTHVRIKLKSNGVSFEKKYQLGEIVLAQKFVKMAQNFFMQINDKRYTVVDKAFDTLKISRTERENIKGMFQKIDSAEGKCRSIVFKSFDLKSIDVDNKPVIMINTDVSYKNRFADYLLVFMVKDEKIIHFGINEKIKY